MFAEIKNGAVLRFPYDYDTLCQENPSTAFPADTHLLMLYAGTEANLAGASLVPVIEASKPEFNESTHKLIALAPVFNGSQWVREWGIESLTTYELAQANTQKAKSVREQRNQKLKDSDWTQVADAPVSQLAWATYRQALRDIPSQQGFPWDVQWPTQPE